MEQRDWPELPAFAEWEDTFSTLHMWVQIVGKIRLALSPRLNHSWGCALYATPRGLTTSPMPYPGRTFGIDFDWVGHELRIETSDAQSRAIPLRSMTVAEFYQQVMDGLHELGIGVRIFTRPVEVVEAIRFDEDTRHAQYEAEVVGRFWKALSQADRVFKAFRSGFIGKASPVQFYWGACDLAAARFSGRTAPLHPGGMPNCPDWVMQEAYSHEVASAGFWPGAGLGEAAFYAYTYPEPAGYSARRIQPEAAYYSDTLREFILPYAAVRNAADSDRTLLKFLQTSYAAAADLAGWDRAALERSLSPQR